MEMLIETEKNGGCERIRGMPACKKLTTGTGKELLKRSFSSLSQLYPRTSFPFAKNSFLSRIDTHRVGRGNRTFSFPVSSVMDRAVTWTYYRLQWSIPSWFLLRLEPIFAYFSLSEHLYCYSAELDFAASYSWLIASRNASPSNDLQCELYP